MTSARVAAATEDPHARRHALETAIAQAETALAHLTQAVSEGGTIATLVQVIRDQERRHQTLRAEPRVVPLSVGHLKAMLNPPPSAPQSNLVELPLEQRRDHCGSTPPHHPFPEGFLQ